MVVDDRFRHELHRRLEEVLGPEEAATLIEHLPRVGWADVATRYGLSGLEQRSELRFARMDDRLAAVDGRLDRMDERLNGVEERLTDPGRRFDRPDDPLSDLQAAIRHGLRSQAFALVFGVVSIVLIMAVLTFAVVRFR